MIGSDPTEIVIRYKYGLWRAFEQLPTGYPREITSATSLELLASNLSSNYGVDFVIQAVLVPP